MDKQINRLPYYLNYMLGINHGTDFMLGTISDGWLSESFPFPIPEEMAEFFVKYTVCAKCGRRFKPELKPCRCKNDYELEDFDECIIIARLSHYDEVGIDIYRNIWRPIIERESRRVKAFYRNQKIMGNGSHTKKEIDELLKIQMNRCYYCGKNISDTPKSKIRFHVDHYQAIYHEGSNSITNIVLACQYCNIQKGIENGYSYRTKAIRRADNEHKIIIRKIRNAVDRFWKENGKEE